MARMTSAQLRQKDVINVCDGTRLGCITEIEFDSRSGQICSLILSSGGLISFSRESRIVLPWNRIDCIGEDAILVRISKTEYDAFFRAGKRCKSFEKDRE